MTRDENSAPRSIRTNMADSHSQRARLLEQLLGPSGPELSCDECFELLDVYVEAELATADADLLVPGMRAHLEGCPACAEEHGSLRDLAAHAR
jgi:hypothetical protein